MQPSVRGNMGQLMSVSIKALRCAQAVCCAILLWLAPAFDALSEPTHAVQMSQRVEITALGAPLNVLLHALFANTEMQIEISENLPPVVVEGRFDGTVASVLNVLKLKHDLVTHIQGGSLQVLPSTSAPEIKIARVTRSMTDVLPIVDNSTSITDAATRAAPADQSAKKLPTRKLNIEKPVIQAKRILDISSGTQSKQRKQTKQVDKLVERMFVLKHAKAVDTQVNDAQQTLTPGVATQLKLLVEKLGVANFTYIGAPSVNASQSVLSIVALPTMNAVVVKDLESRMALYQDLIESLDVVSVENSTQWTVVQ